RRRRGRRVRAYRRSPSRGRDSALPAFGRNARASADARDSQRNGAQRDGRERRSCTTRASRVDTRRGGRPSRPLPGHPPLTTQRLVVVTGKGGVGKTAVTAALARVAMDAGRRVLAVEVGQARLGPLLDAPEPLETDPKRLTPTLSAAAIAPEEARRDFVHGVLRLRVFARRLLESTSFQVLAAAAPGLAEFLVLHKINGWLDARRLGRPLYDVVVVDAPASGHSLPLLDAPRTLGALARIGPVA